MPATVPDAHAEAWAKWLNAELDDRGWSGPTLATALGIYRPTVYRWTSGRTRPRASQVPAIAKALGVEPDRVFSAAGFRPYKYLARDELRRQIAELIAEIPDELLLPLLPMLRGLASDPAQQELAATLAAWRQP